MSIESSLNDFVYTVRGAVDHAGQEMNNDGGLWKEYQGDLDHVEFPAPENALLPEGVDLKGEPLKITARDWYGQGYDSLAFWLETKSQPGWEMPGIIASYDPHNSERNRFEIGHGSGRTDEETFSKYATSYMSLMPNFSDYVARHGMALAFREGINRIAESSIAVNHLVMRTGHKIAPNGHTINGFQLEASIMDETNADKETTTTIEAELKYYFQPNLDDMPYGGRLLRAVSVTLQNDTILASERKLEISLMDNPFINGDQLGAYSDGEASDESKLPTRLRELLYPDNLVSSEDITYFTNLITKPLEEKDVKIF